MWAIKALRKSDVLLVIVYNCWTSTKMSNESPNRVIFVRDTLMQTELPSQPWHFIASDLSEVENRQYLLMTVRQCKYPLGDEVCCLRSYEDVQDVVWSSGRNCEWHWTRVQWTTVQEVNWFLGNQTCDELATVCAEQRIYRKKPCESSDIQLALYNLRPTPIETNLLCPGEILLGRPLVTLLQNHSEP